MLARKDARIAELEAQIEEGKTRQPGADSRRPGGGSAPAPEEDWDIEAIRTIKG